MTLGPFRRIRGLFCSGGGGESTQIISSRARALKNAFFKPTFLTVGHPAVRWLAWSDFLLVPLFAAACCALVPWQAVAMAVVVWAADALLFVVLDGYDLMRRFALFQQAGMLAVIAIGESLALAAVSYAAPAVFPVFPLMSATVAGIYLVRVAVRKAYYTLVNTRRVMERVCVVGTGWLAQRVGQTIESRRSSGWSCLGIVSGFDADEVGRATLVIDARDTVVDLRPGRRADRHLRGPETGTIRLLDAQDFHEAMARRIPLPDPDTKPAPIAHPPLPSRPLHDLANGVINVAIGLIGMITAVPLMFVVAACILLEDRGPVLYSQQRIGHRGRPFTIYKFRTMQVGARDRHLKEGGSGARYVTKVGRWLRKFRLDELPQFLNLLKRDLNLVGPRPFVSEEASLFARELPWFENRYAVLPGITGLAQVCYGHDNSLHDGWVKLSYDLFYVKNRGFFLDVLIIAWSVGAVLFGRGK